MNIGKFPKESSGVSGWSERRGCDGRGETEENGAATEG